MFGMENEKDIKCFNKLGIGSVLAFIKAIEHVEEVLLVKKISLFNIHLVLKISKTKIVR